MVRSTLFRPQFTLRATFFFVTFIVAILAAYRYGHHEGRRIGPVIPSTFSSHLIYPREYDVRDLVGTGNSVEPRNLSALIDNVSSSVAPSTWDFVGGYATIVPGKSQTSLVVDQTSSGHAEVIKHLTDIRDEIEGDSLGTPFAVVLRIVSDRRNTLTGDVGR